ncbi:MAG: tRNA (guanosine(37)-N1)-methyltransferase TrmD [Anaerolineales bacterium]
MHIHLLTLFPEVCHPYLDTSIVGRAQKSGHLRVSLHDIRDYATDRHHVTDDAPYGGGGGMIIKPEPVFAAVESIVGREHDISEIILLTPQGRLFSQDTALKLAKLDQIILIAGRYEGFDERIRKHLVTDEISVGDYVVTGGELPALLVVDAIARLIPGVLGAVGAAENDSHGESGILEHPHYTRPVNFRGWDVPDVLLSGNHEEIANWRKKQSLRRTWQRRPELLIDTQLSEYEKECIAELAEESVVKWK